MKENPALSVNQKNYRADFRNRLFFKKKYLVFIMVGLLLATGLASAFYLSKQNQELRQQASSKGLSCNQVCTEKNECAAGMKCKLITSSLPGFGPVQATSIAGSFSQNQNETYHQTFWRNNQRYYRIIPAGQDSSPEWDQASPWQEQGSATDLPGSGKIQATNILITIQSDQNHDRRNNGPDRGPSRGGMAEDDYIEFTESIWRNNQGYYRTIPANPRGQPDFSQASPWSDPVSVTDLPGEGQGQSLSLYQWIDHRRNLHFQQSFWKGGQGFYRYIPAKDNYTPDWNAADPWSEPLSDFILPGDGLIQAQTTFYWKNERLNQSFFGQIVWRGNYRYYRQIPANSESSPAWEQASNWGKKPLEVRRCRAEACFNDKDCSCLQASNPSLEPTNRVEPTNKPVDNSIYYVSNGGNDSNPGTEAKPFLTLEYALSQLQGSGQIMIKSGTYRLPDIKIDKSGTSKDHLIISGENQTNKPKLIANDDNIFSVEGNFIKIEHLDFSQARTAISINGNNVLINNVDVHDNDLAGIGIAQVQNVKIRNSNFYNNKNTGLFTYGPVKDILVESSVFDGTSGIQNRGIATWKADGLTGLTIKQTIIKNHPGYGATIMPDHGETKMTDVNIIASEFRHNGIQAEPANLNGFLFRPANLLIQRVQGGIIERSTFAESPGWGIDIYCSHNLVIKNNLFINNQDRLPNPVGPAVGLEINSGTNNLVLHNTFYGNKVGLFSSSINSGGPWPPAPGSLTVTNNIIYNNDNNYQTHYDPASPVSVTKKSNLIGVNPFFTNINQEDFSLQAESPALDAAVDSSVNYDFLKVARPQGTNSDIGAYEATLQTGNEPTTTNSESEVETAISPTSESSDESNGSNSEEPVTACRKDFESCTTNEDCCPGYACVQFEIQTRNESSQLNAQKKCVKLNNLSR